MAAVRADDKGRGRLVADGRVDVVHEDEEVAEADHVDDAAGDALLDLVPVAVQALGRALTRADVANCASL